MSQVYANNPKINFIRLRLITLFCLLTYSFVASALDPVPVEVDVSFKTTMTPEAFGGRTATATIVLFSLKKQLYEQFDSFTGDKVNITSFSIKDIVLSAPRLSLPVTISSLSFGYRDQMNLPTRWLLQADNLSLSDIQSGNYQVNKKNEFTEFSNRINADVTGTKDGNYSLPRVYFVLYIVFSSPALDELEHILKQLDVDVEIKANISADMTL